MKPVSLRREPFSCPFCGHKLEATTGLGGAEVPDDGSLSICLYCGGVGQFVDQARRVVPFDLSTLDADPEERARIEQIRDRIREGYAAMKDKEPPAAGGNRHERRARKAKSKREFPPGYIRIVERLGADLGAWIKAGREPPLFALPDKAIMLAASLEHVGARVVRNDAAREFLAMAIAAGEKDGGTTVFQLGVALEVLGVPIERVTLSELGLSPTGGLS